MTSEAKDEENDQVSDSNDGHYPASSNMGYAAGGPGHNDAYQQPIDISAQDQEDLDAVIESISYGKT